MKKTTIDDLARMVTKGFTEAKKDLTEGLSSLEGRLSAQIKGIDERLSTAEFLLSSNRIEHLEDDMRQVKTILKIK